MQLDMQEDKNAMTNSKGSLTDLTMEELPQNLEYSSSLASDRKR